VATVPTRDTTIRVRVTTGEKAALKRLAHERQLDGGVSELIRRAALGELEPKEPEPPPPPPAARGAVGRLQIGKR